MKKRIILYPAKRISIFLIMVFLVVGMGGCETSCAPTAAPVLQYSLVISSSTGGSVSTPGEGNFVRQDGTTVNLKAETDECYEFVGWTGDAVADPSSAATTIFMNANKEIVANFSLRNHDLTVSSTEGGSVAVPGEGSFIYECGATVNLAAETDDGYRFVEWTGSINTIGDAYAAQTTIIINDNLSISAKFIRQYSLNISSTEGGSVTSPGEGAFVYDDGAVVNLTAEAGESYSFSGWTGDIGTINDPGAAQATIVIDGHYNIIANFILFNGGNGTAEDPYQVADWRQMDNIRNHLDSHFILVNSLDSTGIGYEELASQSANGGKGWQSIGNLAGKFTGNFDGRGHKVSDLFINRPDEDSVGLFGIVHEEGFLKNIGVANAYVAGKDNTGIIVGKNEGAVDSSYSTGSVTGNNYVGGLVGKNEGNVSDSYSTGNIIGDTRIGGLVGQNENTINNSYSTGSVTGNNYVGGLVGKNEGSVSNSFWDTEASGQAVSGGGTGKTTAEMQTLSTFATAEWDIVAVDHDEIDNNHTWNIVDGETYPFLSFLG